jgi:ankyrin repeat protein
LRAQKVTGHFLLGGNLKQRSNKLHLSLRIDSHQSFNLPLQKFCEVNVDLHGKTIDTFRATNYCSSLTFTPIYFLGVNMSNLYRITSSAIILLCFTITPLAQTSAPPPVPGQDSSATHFCAAKHKEESVKLSPDSARNADNHSLEDACTPLMAAAEKGDAVAVRTHLKAGDKIDASLKSGLTSLMLAAKEGHLEIVKILLDAGANPNVRFHTAHLGEMSALSYALLSKNKEVVETMIDAGAEVNPRDFEGMPPLLFAIYDSSDPKLVKTLLAKGAQVNFKTRTGMTALMIATLKNSPAIVEILLSAGANVSAESTDGATALSLAVEAGSDRIVQLLKGAGAVK